VNVRIKKYGSGRIFYNLLLRLSPLFVSVYLSYIYVQLLLPMPKDVSLLKVCLTVKLLTRLLRKLWTDFHETWKVMYG